MDPAFRTIDAVLPELLPAARDLVDPHVGVRSRVVACEVEIPVELDVAVDVDGRPTIGVSAPLYLVDTSLRPSYHRLRFTARLEEAGDG